MQHLNIYLYVTGNDCMLCSDTHDCLTKIRIAGPLQTMSKIVCHLGLQNSQGILKYSNVSAIHNYFSSMNLYQW